ncbi:MAG: SAM-dependent methyltransferase [Clostridiales bacterium]|jgi:tRNA (adenine22-N1)-methyltransferase|nr:SAM-dependent methyltransferase [Clostridiales bacterium]
MKQKRMHELGSRLLTVAGLVPYGSRIADIGTDHAYLPVYLASKGLISRAIASDINPLPLENARKNIDRFDAGGVVELKLSDGIKGIDAKAVDVFIIAGMGGETIAEIMRDAAGYKQKFILSPMTNAVKLRRALYSMGFSIKRELLAREGYRIYPIMEVYYTGICFENSLYERASKALLDGDSEHKREYIEKTVRSIEKEAKAGENVEELLALADTLRRTVK